MKFVCCLILFICLSLSCIAQSKTDSLKNLLNIAKQEDDKVYMPYYLSQIGWENQNTQQYDSALHYYYRSLAFSSTDLKLKASNLNNVGLVYDRKGFMDSSLVYYNAALKVCTELQDTANIVSLERNLAIIYKNLGLYEKALESAFSAIAALEKQKPDRALASSYNTIAEVYLKMEDYRNALVYHRKALNVRIQIEYVRGIGQSYNNLGEVFIRMHQYDSALANLSHSINVKENAGDTVALGTTLNLMGEAYIELNNLRDAESYLIKSLKIKKASGERVGEAIALNNLGKVKLIAKDLKSAENYLNQAGDLIRQTGALDELRKNLELKVALYKTTANYSIALQYAEELMIIKDSLLNKNKLESLLAMQARYESEKKEQHISLLEQDKAIQIVEIKTKKQWIQSLIITITLVSLIGLLLFYSYKESQRNKNKVETLLKELHHRVKNNLQILSSVLSLQSQHLKDENAIQVMKSSESRVNTMALIHKKLYGNEDNRSIQMNGYIQELVQYLIHSYGFEQKELQFSLQGEEITLDVDKAIPLGLILNEVVSNALKYAFVNHKTPKLNVKMKMIDSSHLKLVVTDNGPGISDLSAFETPQSFGLKMVNTLARELKGKVTVHSDHGTIFILQIPTT